MGFSVKSAATSGGPFDHSFIGFRVEGLGFSFIRFRLEACGQNNQKKAG